MDEVTYLSQKPVSRDSVAPYAYPVNEPIYPRNRGVNPGGWGSRPPDFGQGVVGVTGWSWGRGRVVKKLSDHVQEICWKVVTFEEK